MTTAPPSFRRGYMLDTSRHFVPTEEILTLLDGMFAAKLNIFHWRGQPWAPKPFPCRPVCSVRIITNGYSAHRAVGKK